MRIAKVLNNDLGNGPGVRTTMFVSGCPIHCPGCHNPELQDFNTGVSLSEHNIDKIISLLKVDGIERGFSVLGGEPLAEQNLPGLSYLLTRIRASLPDCNIWLWTGYTVEELFQRYKGSLQEKNFYDIINTVNVVVDGPFKEALKGGEHPWRGSSNQRILTRKEVFEYGSKTGTTSNVTG